MEYSLLILTIYVTTSQTSKESNTNGCVVYRLPLPLVQLAGGWTMMHSPHPTQLAVEESFLKVTENHILTQKDHPLDKVEARADVFSEMQSYWSIPIKETAALVGLAVSKGKQSEF
jgi:hypothetical protein